jgi:hypothetical protein
METDHPLSAFRDRRVGEYEIVVEGKPLRSRQGWTYFSLHLKDKLGRISAQQTQEGVYLAAPVLEGIHSRGGRSVKGWIEVGDYFPVTYFRSEGSPLERLSLSARKLDVQIFQLLGEVVPPGGHLMFAYEVSYESPFHRETQECLLRGIPPVCTAQGELLFRSGFRWVKDWYLAEGGHEGPRKLWGEKPLDERGSKRFDLMTYLQLLAYSSRKPVPSFIEPELAAKRRLLNLLVELNLEPNLSILRDRIVSAYRGRLKPAALEEAVSHCCRLINFFKTAQLETGVAEELRNISQTCSTNLP